MTTLAAWRKAFWQLVNLEQPIELPRRAAEWTTKRKYGNNSYSYERDKRDGT